MTTPDTTRLLNSATLNKGTAFSQQERVEAHLEGLLPPVVDSLETQIKRVLEHLDGKPNDIEKYIYLQELADRNETLFFATLMSDPVTFIPLVYDPTIADACLKYGHIYRRPKGMYLTHKMKGRLKEVLRNWPQKEVQFICITSGGRILGLGDIGANGAPIPVGKLQLYTACAAVPPQGLLPIHLDIGTRNKPLRDDPLYTGLREEKLQQQDLDELLDEFVEAVNEVFPGCCIHFEDWEGNDAIRYLQRYQQQALVYNDDIQGTASVVLAGLLTALKTTGGKLAEQRILFAGAGSAGTGIANMLVEAMVQEGAERQQARQAITLFDKEGLIESSRNDLNDSQKIYARRMEAEQDLQKVVESVKPTMLIGVSTQGGLFTEGVVKALSELNDRPIIFALSNPTKNAECTAKQAYDWSKGNALFAAGVQFGEEKVNGETRYPGQANNFYIFPAVSLAVYAAKPKRIDDALFIEAARLCAQQVSKQDRERGKLYPSQADILSTEIAIASGLVRYLFKEKQAGVKEPEDIDRWMQKITWRPRYQ
ncbi:NAD-dependent malic enzyme [Pantoea sp. CCBC3-3-1]|uniref:NAD-dependent malic enzyme n=1 Tax=Pantoea sp. CCBC3-3-1 TaxID=2490851 RepID=UPI0011BEF5A8|nr:NAD-dependent malic enzyme [Pantoea sp. CCBC3-3-1]